MNLTVKDKDSYVRWLINTVSTFLTCFIRVKILYLSNGVGLDDRDLWRTTIFVVTGISFVTFESIFNDWLEMLIKSLQNNKKKTRDCL